MDQPPFKATESLIAYSKGDVGSAKELMPLVYNRLRKLAATYMLQERPGHTLQPTELVHEAYVRLVDIKRVDWRGKAHFFAMAARQMRRVLIDHARARAASKRSGGLRRVTLQDDIALGDDLSLDLLALDEALDKLAQRHERGGRVAELRIFAGMQVREIGHALNVSERTIVDDWHFARAWLAKQLLTGEGTPE